ncbi:MAG TPA: DUF4412 domain-containing protein [Gemmatimonadaceae bacterium]
MNARISFAIVIAATMAIPVVTSAQSNFEGVITFQMDAGRGGPSTMEYSVKDSSVRVDMSAQGMNMFTLYDGSKKTIDMVIPMRQMYMERSAEVPQAMADAAVKKHDITWTGKKETIAGYECEHATTTDDDGSTVDMCLAKGLGAFVQMGGGMGGRGRGGPPAGWENHVGDSFPLKVQHGDQVQLLVTKIEKKSLDASLFTVPDGYQKMNMPMGGGR